MGAGKSTGARALAAGLGVEPLDSDRVLEQRLGEPIESFFDREGEPAFRAREEEVVLELLERPEARVIALGGGALRSARVRDALADHTVVHLEVEPEEAWRRASNHGRPLARDPGRFAALHSDRVALYDSAADVIVPPGEREGIRRVLPALEALGGARRRAPGSYGPRPPRASTPSSSAPAWSPPASSIRARAVASS